ncbi:MAG: MnmC family methyltransferase [Sulfurovaceae bacterium]|nr:MnmC family methyltransferase [Sulfurovaceae bacterium]
MALYNKSLRSFKKVIPTSDNTNTLYSTEFDECYHSTKDGALNESLNKHIIPAFNLLKQKEKIIILDICFGLGYNTLATVYYCKTNNIKTKIEIISPEIDEDLVKSLKDFSYPKEFDSILHIINSISDNLHYEDEQFKISVIVGDARKSLPTLTQRFDIIYQDAFSPKNNPLLWTKEYFALLHESCSNDIIITTYSSATTVRMGLYENGFLIYEHSASGIRAGTIASLKALDLKLIDMELKISRNKEAKSLKDSDFK